MSEGKSWASDGRNQTHWHQAFESDDKVRKTYRELWRVISNYLSHIPDRNLVFNVLNEPEFEQMKVWNKREIWNEWSTEIVDSIRSISPNRTIVIEGIYKSLWARYNNPEKLLMPIDRKNIIYGFHYYSHQEWAAQDTEGWFQGVSGVRMPYLGEVKSHMNQLIRYSEKHNVPVMVSEIGVNGQCDGNGPKPNERAKYISTVYETLIPKRVGITWWAIESPANSPYLRVSGNCYRNLDKELIPDDLLFKALRLTK